MHPLYADFNSSDPDLNKMTLCLDCAKHPSLKRFVDRYGVEGPVCGICQEVNYPYRACAADRKDDLVNLTKALVRFYFDEHEYNPHWGGDDGPSFLLTATNPILEDQSTAHRTRSREQSADFLYDLFSALPYPNPEEGLSIYAGHDDGIRNISFSLKDNESWKLRSLRERLATENYFDVEPSVSKIFDQFANRITQVIPAGARYFRARIGISGRYADRSDTNGWDHKVLRKPYTGNEIGAPPPQIATPGRLNRAGVSFLYLASDTLTAAAEIRPHPGHYLSIGAFECHSEIKIASFEADLIDFSGSEHDLELFHFIYSTDVLMARPVVPGEARRYSITQLLAECIRQKGFDGVMFKSSVGQGQNLCVFKPDLFAYVDGTAEVHEVKSLSYDLKPCPTVLKPDLNGSHFQI